MPQVSEGLVICATFLGHIANTQFLAIGGRDLHT